LSRGCLFVKLAIIIYFKSGSKAHKKQWTAIHLLAVFVLFSLLFVVAAIWRIKMYIYMRGVDRAVLIVAMLLGLGEL